MNTSGFYKKELFQIQFAGNFVYTPNNTLLRDLALTYSFPVDGWYWFDTAQQAYDYFGIPYTEIVYENKTDIDLRKEAVDNKAAIDIAAKFGKPAKSMDLLIVQQNFTARAVSLIEKKQSAGSLTQQEQKELDDIKTLWSAIKSIRVNAELEKGAIK